MALLLCVRVCFGGFLGTCASPSKVSEKDMTGQLIGDYMIGLSEDERKAPE
jgi:hypothetical protein